MHLRLKVLTAVLWVDSSILGYGAVVSYICKAHIASITHSVTLQCIPADKSSVIPLSWRFVSWDALQCIGNASNMSLENVGNHSTISQNAWIYSQHCCQNLQLYRYPWRMLVSAVMNLRVPWNAGNFLTSCKPVSFSRRTLHHGVSKYTFIHFLLYHTNKCYVFTGSRGNLCCVLDHVQLNQFMACLCRLNSCLGSICGQKAIARL